MHLMSRDMLGGETLRFLLECVMRSRYMLHDVSCTKLLLLANGLLGLTIEYLHILHVEYHLHIITHLVARARVDPGDEAVLAVLQVNEDLVAH